MIDFHTHILPGMDDGSHSLEESREMLLAEYRQGVRELVLTPHYYASEEFPEQFLQRRRKSLDSVQEMLQQETWGREMRIHVGAEVYYFSGMGSSEALPQLCIEGTDVLLLEMPFRQWDMTVLADVLKVLRYQKLTVVLAHIDRYWKWQKNREAWDEILLLPLYVQMNADVFLSWGKKILGMRLLRDGSGILLGSDCHDLNRRPPNLTEAWDIIRRKAGSDVLERISQTERQVLPG